MSKSTHNRANAHQVCPYSGATGSPIRTMFTQIAKAAAQPREHAQPIGKYRLTATAPMRTARCATSRRCASARWRALRTVARIDWPKTRGRRKMKTEKRDKVRQTVPHSLLRAENRSLVRGMASDNNTPLAAKTATNECQECHFWHRPVPALFNRQTISTTGIKKRKRVKGKWKKVACRSRVSWFQVCDCFLCSVLNAPCPGASTTRKREFLLASHPRPTRVLLQSYSNPTRVLLASYSPPALGKMPKTGETGREARDFPMNKTRRKKVGRKRRDMHQIGRQRGEVNRGFHGEHGCFQEIPNGGTSVNLSAKICVIRGSSLPTAEQLRFFLTGCPRRPGRYYWTMFVSPSKLNLFQEGA